MTSNNNTKIDKLGDELLIRILSRLGIASFPAPDFSGLKTIYAAWCQKIPFDNLFKRIHLESNNSAPLPGDNPVDFFEGWLRFATGGTCWAGSGALFSLLSSLNFKVYRAVATMLITPDLPPNHGTVVVDLDNEQFLVDTSILHGTPMRINTNRPKLIRHPAWGIDGSMHNNKWYIRWRPLHMLDGCTCRIDQIDVSHQTFVQLNEETRKWGPFNFSLYARINRGDSVVGLAYGNKVSIDPTNNIECHEADVTERRQFFIEELGIGNRLVNSLPVDKPTPPPPKSKS